MAGRHRRCACSRVCCRLCAPHTDALVRTSAAADPDLRGPCRRRAARRHRRHALAHRARQARGSAARRCDGHNWALGRPCRSHCVGRLGLGVPPLACARRAVVCDGRERTAPGGLAWLVNIERSRRSVSPRRAAQCRPCTGDFCCAADGPLGHRDPHRFYHRGARGACVVDRVLSGGGNGVCDTVASTRACGSACGDGACAGGDDGACAVRRCASQAGVFPAHPAHRVRGGARVARTHD
eukprot:Amastigsp_a508862_9.p3 type:complete len:239 gc:universal Amastigsp_a508862_9:1319-603(-)